jgi:predicted RNA binding protein YcfA (HicA-like mRNA interferase family)
MKPGAIIRILLRNGFVERKAKGGHRQFIRPQPPPARVVTVAYHPKDLSKHNLHSIMVQSGKSADEFR